MRRLDGDGNTREVLISLPSFTRWEFSLLALENLLIFVSVFAFFSTGANISGFAKRDAQIHSSNYSQGIVYHSPCSSLKERKALISSTRIMGIHLNSRISEDSTSKSYHYGIEFHIAFLSFLLIVPAAMNENRRTFWAFTREVFPVLHDSVVHLMSC